MKTCAVLLLLSAGCGGHCDEDEKIASARIDVSFQSPVSASFTIDGQSLTPFCFADTDMGQCTGWELDVGALTDGAHTLVIDAGGVTHIEPFTLTTLDSCGAREADPHFFAL